jgi:hypothetical protein
MRSRNIRLALISCFCCGAALALAGCVKGDISVDVRENGTGVLSVSLGLTQQAKALLSSQGSTPLQMLEQSMSNGPDSTSADVKIDRWTEGDYEWVKAEKEFKTLAEINADMLKRPLFKHFSLSRRRGVIQDEFILDAELDALNADMPTDYGSPDAAGIGEINFSARLPGSITETNGFSDAKDPRHFLWSMQSNQTVPIRMRSLVWNWGNILGMLVVGAVFVALGIFAVGGLRPILHPAAGSQTHSRWRAQPQRPQTGGTGAIGRLGVPDLLSQVNSRALNSIGQFFTSSGAVALIWTNNRGQRRYIEVQELPNDQISINGQVCVATRDNVKAALITALQQQQS